MVLMMETNGDGMMETNGVLKILLCNANILISSSLASEMFYLVGCFSLVTRG